MSREGELIESKELVSEEVFSEPAAFQTDDSGRTALMKAAESKPDLIESLLGDLSADQIWRIQTLTDHRENTALMYAVISGELAAVKALLDPLTTEQIFNLQQIQNSSGMIALMYAVDPGLEDVLSFLLSKVTKDQVWALQQIIDRNHENTLMHSAINNIRAFELLLYYMSSDQIWELLQKKNAYGFTVLQLVVHDSDAIALLLRLLTPKQVWALQQIQDGESHHTPLMSAASFRGYRTVDLLLAMLKPDQIWQLQLMHDLHGVTALMLAARAQPAAIKPLLKPLSYDETVTLLQINDVFGCTALMRAARYQPESIPLLLNLLTQRKSLKLISTQASKPGGFYMDVSPGDNAMTLLNVGLKDNPDRSQAMGAMLYALGEDSACTTWSGGAEKSLMLSTLGMFRRVSDKSWLRAEEDCSPSINMCL